MSVYEGIVELALKKPSLFSNNLKKYIQIFFFFHSPGTGQLKVSSGGACFFLYTAGVQHSPLVVCPQRVLVVDGWDQYMDEKKRIKLVVNNEKRITFDVSSAGPGEKLCARWCIFVMFFTSMLCMQCL